MATHLNEWPHPSSSGQERTYHRWGERAVSGGYIDGCAQESSDQGSVRVPFLYQEVGVIAC